MNLMSVLVLTVVTFAVQIDLSKVKAIPDIYAISKECQEESGATDEDVDHFLNHEFSTSMDGMCLRACILKKFNLMDKNGKPLKDLGKNFDHLLDNANTYNILNVCVNLDFSDNHCKAAEQFWTCIKTECHRNQMDTSAFRL